MKLRTSGRTKRVPKQATGSVKGEVAAGTEATRSESSEVEGRDIPASTEGDTVGQDIESPGGLASGAAVPNLQVTPLPKVTTPPRQTISRHRLYNIRKVPLSWGGRV